LNLALGGLGLLSFFFIRDPAWLLLPMIGVGIAWASILSLPYALLSDVLPTAKMGVYMGIFNFFIVIPQLIAASVLGSGIAAAGILLGPGNLWPGDWRRADGYCRTDHPAGGCRSGTRTQLIPTPAGSRIRTKPLLYADPAVALLHHIRPVCAKT
jgi:MFS family permease